MTERREDRAYLGVGLYSVPEASRIIGIHPRQLRRWIRTFTYTAKGHQYLHTPVIPRYFSDEDDKPITFLELIELLFVRLFREEGLSMQYIRIAARIAADYFETPYPFAVKRFDTDGKFIFATLENEPVTQSRRIIEELGKGQIVFETVVRPFFRKLEYSGHAEALRFWPMEREGRVVLDPKRKFGKPIDAETGVPTRALFDAVAVAGQGVQTVAKWFGVPADAVRAAVKYERMLTRAA